LIISLKVSGEVGPNKYVLFWRLWCIHIQKTRFKAFPNLAAHGFLHFHSLLYLDREWEIQCSAFHLTYGAPPWSFSCRLPEP